MKFILLILLLANIIFFLWEFKAPSSHSTQSINTQSKQKLKKIFLLSEVAKQTEKSTVTLNSKKNKTPPAIIVSELQTILNTVPEPPFGKASNSNIIQTHQPIEAIATNKIEIASENKLPLPSVNFDDVKKPESDSASVKSKSEKKVLIEKTEKKALSQTNTPVKSVPSKNTFCYEIGPFQDKNLLDQWLASNKNTISISRQIEKSTSENPKYLVYSPATGNIEQSKENIQKFQKMGVDDLWLFRKGELEGAISFGLFSKENRALDLQKQLSEKGLDAKILQSDMTASHLYLQIITEKKWLKSIFNSNNKQIIANCENS